jgi:hypothetical protein
MELEATEITDAKVYYFHFRGDSGEHEVFTVIIEPSYGMISIISDSAGWTNTWPRKEQWGTSTFNEFLCARPAKWLTSKIMGTSFYEIDFDATQNNLTVIAPDMVDDTELLMADLRQLGLVAASMETDYTDRLSSCMMHPLTDAVLFKATKNACMIAAEVLPCLQSQISPKNLHVC